MNFPKLNGRYFSELNWRLKYIMSKMAKLIISKLQSKFSSVSPQTTAQTSVSVPRKERICCECQRCSERKAEKQRVGLDRAEKNRLLAEQQKYSDPLRGATMGFIERIRELKSYDLDTAKQEQLVFYNLVPNNFISVL